jgi:uncharacterized protein (DUF362 family)
LTTVREYLDTLASQAHPDGGWGYVPGQPAFPEPTCLALLALAAESEAFAHVIAAGTQALRRWARPGGGYRLANGRPEAVWPTAQVLFTRAALGHPVEELRRDSDALVRTRGRVMPDDPEVADMIDIDLKLVGWPWGEGNFSWVEPTSWACLALARLGQEGHPAAEEGQRMLLDRAFDEGGINYGNRRVLGRMTEPIPGPTALMLLALQHHPEHPRVDAALHYLREQLADSTDLEHLGWGKLAFDAHRDHPAAADFLPILDDRIRAAHRDHLARRNAPPGPVRQALTALALDTERRNPFRLVAGPARSGSEGNQNSSPTPRAGATGMFGRVKSAVRGFMVEGLGKFRPPPPTSAVHIATAESYDADLAAVLRRQYEHFRPAVPLAGKRVVIKPNLVEYHRDKVINTDPRVVSAVIELCKAEGAAEVVVAEGPGHWRNVEFLVRESGLGAVLDRHGVRFVDLNHDEPVKTVNLGRLTGLDHLYLTRTVTSADVLISVPKLKTHHWAGATLALKNLFGTLPGTCYGWPKNELHWRGIPNSIIDIALTTISPPVQFLGVIDGIVGMEGDGPLNGRARPMGVLVMGADPLAVDATGCRLMGLDPARVPYLTLGLGKKLGRLNAADVPQLGEPVERLAQPFELPPKIEKQLNRKRA